MGRSFVASRGCMGLVLAKLAWASGCKAPRSPGCELSLHWVVAAGIFCFKGVALGFGSGRSGLQWGTQLGQGGGGTSPFPWGDARETAA